MHDWNLASGQNSEAANCRCSRSKHPFRSSGSWGRGSGGWDVCVGGCVCRRRCRKLSCNRGNEVCNQEPDPWITLPPPL